MMRNKKPTFEFLKDFGNRLEELEKIAKAQAVWELVQEEAANEVELQMDLLRREGKCPKR